MSRTPRRDEDPSPPPFTPKKIEGRTAFCRCERPEGLVELSGPTPVERERIRAGQTIMREASCPACKRAITIEDPWKPREMRTPPPAPPGNPDDETKTDD